MNLVGTLKLHVEQGNLRSSEDYEPPHRVLHILNNMRTQDSTMQCTITKLRLQVHKSDTIYWLEVLRVVFNLHVCACLLLCLYYVYINVMRLYIVIIYSVWYHTSVEPDNYICGA